MGEVLVYFILSVNERFVVIVGVKVKYLQLQCKFVYCYRNEKNTIFLFLVCGVDDLKRRAKLVQRTLRAGNIFGRDVCSLAIVASIER